ncbi:hypothetical protein H310_03355 [Aphanomyces invadans]|uniref:Cyclic nucleotide-binding domain-containing protein n=1 Tax=Aphanomyces invadans TaxID=157072 RepID=A0A024UIB8_9STRA|nr:hypothetical protein H310_03355 [Aphanomyces invadans]ETW05622.1 hypothetical protein H310_03355 [Aphanomyces invadans]|eukprot:XP_008865399.1 hypothetical protein H310_03355 [Aphanomyces invadans]
MVDAATVVHQRRDFVGLVGGPRLDTAAAKEASAAITPMESSPIMTFHPTRPLAEGGHSTHADHPPPTSSHHVSTAQNADPRRPSIVAMILGRAVGSMMVTPSPDGHAPLASGPEDSVLRRATASIQSAANILRRQGSEHSHNGSNRHGLWHQESGPFSSKSRGSDGSMLLRQSSRSVRERKGQVEPMVEEPSGETGRIMHQSESRSRDGSTHRFGSSKTPEGSMRKNPAAPPPHGNEDPHTQHRPSMLQLANVSFKNLTGMMNHRPSMSHGTSDASFKGGAASFSRHFVHTNSELAPKQSASSISPRGSTIVRARSSIMTQINTIAATPRVVPFAPEVMAPTAPAVASTRRDSSASAARPRSLSRFQVLSTKLLTQISAAHAIDHRRISTASSIARHHQVLERYHIRTQTDHAAPAEPTTLKFLVSPDSKLYKGWQLTMVAIIYYQVVAIPYSLVFSSPDADPTHDTFGLTTCALFALDIALNFVTPITTEAGGAIVTNHKQIALSYLRGWFVIDMLSAIPIEAIVYFLSSDRSGTFKFIGVLKTSRLPRLVRVLSLARILQFLRIPYEWKHWLLYSRYAHLIRLCTTITAFAYIIHIMACLWYGAVASPQWLDWIETNYKLKTGSNAYVLSYFCMLTTTMGQSNNLYTNTEYAFSCCCMIQGCLLMAVVFGDVGDLISNYYEDQNNYHQKMESLLASMALMRIPSDLQTRICDYYETMYARYGTLNGDTVLFTKELSKNLSTEVELYLRMGMITRCPMFRLCSPEFVQELVMQLGFQVFMADDFVVARGEIGYEMYFIQSGSCDLIQHQIMFDDHTRKKNKPIHQATGTLVRTLLEGDFFGEIALLMNCKQTVTLKATMFTEICVLTRDLFHDITAKYVDDHKVIESFIREKYDPHVLNAALEMQIDPLKAKRKAIISCLNDLAERLEFVEARLIRLETCGSNVDATHYDHHHDIHEHSAMLDMR